MLCNMGFSVGSTPTPNARYFTAGLAPPRKLLGDNPDAVYYGTVVDPEGTFKIRGNTMGATYTSFTVEGGRRGRQTSPQGWYRLLTTVNSRSISMAAMKIIASQQQPEEGAWLKLAPGAGGITTRHYFEMERDIAADPHFFIFLCG